MAGISAKTLSLMLSVVCMAMLVPSGQAQLIPSPFPPFQGQIPPLPLPELQKCFAAVTSTPGCLMEIYNAFLSGQFDRLGSVCCASIAQVSEDCWPKIFPLSPLFPPLLKAACGPPSPNATAANAKSKVSFPGLAPGIVNATEIIECWSSIAGIDGCILDIYKSILDIGNIGRIGSACCKAVTEINDKCWPKMVPFNPLFPPLLKTTCAKVIGAAQPPKAG